MELVNEIYVSEVKDRTDEISRRVMREAIETVVLLLSPFVPHFAEELWEALGNQESIIKTPWPDYDREAVVEEEILIVIQVNGKLRDRMTIPASYGEEEVKAWALKSERIQEIDRRQRDQAGDPCPQETGQYCLLIGVETLCGMPYAYFCAFPYPFLWDAVIRWSERRPMSPRA